MTPSDPIVDRLMGFLAASPTPFHAVRSLAAQLSAAGFTALDEAAAWSPQSGAAYFAIREGSLVAFRMGNRPAMDSGFRIVGAHTDSPCLRVKPRPELISGGYLRLGVEVYGGVLLSTWFDRDLSLAGRVSFVDADGAPKSRLVAFSRPIAVVPSLAIHLNREVNERRSINAQAELSPLVARVSADTDLASLLRDELLREREKNVARVLAWDLCFHDTQAPARVGLSGEFLASARLDNLLSCFTGACALAASAAVEATQVFVANDHEEVGSGSATGAAGTLLRDTLERIAGAGEPLARAARRSVLVSTDNAHGVHPSYPDKHDPQHRPVLGGGPVLKFNSAQRYATTAETAGMLRWIAERAEVPLQEFVSRSDMPCGSTIGPITAARLGVPAVDVGVPTFAMHSIRELAGTADVGALARLLEAFYCA